MAGQTDKCKIAAKRARKRAGEQMKVLRKALDTRTSVQSATTGERDKG